MNVEKIKTTSFTVSKAMCVKVTPTIKEGDTIIISMDSKDKPSHGQYVLISWNEYQWIDKFWSGMRKKYQNIYPIVKIIINE